MTLLTGVSDVEIDPSLGLPGRIRIRRYELDGTSPIDVVLTRVGFGLSPNAVYWREVLTESGIVWRVAR